MKENGLPYKNKSGFKVPENYFGDFEARMLDKVRSLEGETTLPENANPFKTPDSYFDNFETRLFEKLEKDKKDPKVISLLKNKYLSYVATIAAVLAIIFATHQYTRTQSFDFEDLEITEVENYLLESFDHNTPEETHLIKEGYFSFTTSGSDKLNREAVLEYLNENMEDPSLLLNED
jgi:hypothetical protein